MFKDKTPKEGVVRSVLAAGAATTAAVGLALGQAAPAQADVVVVVVKVVVVSGGSGYVQPVWDACQSQWGRDFVPWDNDNGCARWDGFDFRAFASINFRVLGGGQVFCPGQYHDRNVGDTRYVANYDYNEGWYPDRGNQQYGGYPPPANLPDAPPLPPPDYGGYPY